MAIVKILLIASALLAVSFAVFTNRQRILLFLAKYEIQKNQTRDEFLPSNSVHWFDDYYTVEKLDDQTYVIGEPLYWQQNFMYLFLGIERALLFDTGPGIRNINDVVKSITDLPVMAIPSHLHYDHVGNLKHFKQVGLSEVLRPQSSDGHKFRPTVEQHLGHIEGFAFDQIRVQQWIKEGQKIDLGGKVLEFFSAPGHTPDSLILIDSTANRIFSGDFIYPGMLVNILPGSSLKDSLMSIERLLHRFAGTSYKIYGAHRQKSRDLRVKPLDRENLENYGQILRAIREGQVSAANNIYPSIYHIDDKMQMIGDLPFAYRRQASE